uniref:Orf67 n=1 Tax=Dichelobacter nodosus TaxID=870 RepID=Q5I717_DICNO|nr:Orf67 [Dichelobacter nodosus]
MMMLLHQGRVISSYILLKHDWLLRDDRNNTAHLFRHRQLIAGRMNQTETVSFLTCALSKSSGNSVTF